HWYVNPNRSLEIADLIITTGELRADLAMQALGWMAKGDAIKLLGKMSAAWDMLDHAGDLYQQAGDEIGWARTRIGRLYARLDLNRFEEALADAERAQEIFLKHKVWMRLIRIHIATAQVYDLLGDHMRALNSYRLSATIALELGEDGKGELCTIYNNMG